MTVLLDTDVLLDVALDRAPHAAASADLLDALQAGAAQGILAWHSISNLHYLLAPRHGRASSRRFIADLLDFLEIAPTTTDGARSALRLPMADFEDALQAAAAVAGGARWIATRNVRDFTHSPVPAISPVQLLARI